MVVRLHRTTDDGVSFTVYEVWQFERWNYWRCREQLKLLIAFCDQARRLISYSGYELSDEDIEALRTGRVMPVAAMEKIHRVSWYPDDYACIRDKVTKEIEDWPLVQKAYESGNMTGLSMRRSTDSRKRRRGAGTAMSRRPTRWRRRPIPLTSRMRTNHLGHLALRPARASLVVDHRGRRRSMPRVALHRIDRHSDLDGRSTEGRVQ